MSARDFKSDRQFNAGFARCLPIEIARSKFMTARRLARGRFRRKRVALGVRSVSVLNVCGVRIWSKKWRPFGGEAWRGKCATIARSIERREAWEWRALAERWAHEIGVIF